MPRSYDDEIISLEVGSGYRNLEDFWVNHERKKIWRTVSPAPSYNTSGVWCLPRQCFNFFFFFQAEQTVRKRLPRKYSSYEVRGCGLAPTFKVRTKGTLLNVNWQPR